MRIAMSVILGVWSMTTLHAQKPLNSFPLPGTYCQQLKQAKHPANPTSYTVDGRADSLHLIYTDLTIDMTQHAQGEIRGEAALHLSAKVAGVQQIRLDFLQMNVDSVTRNGIAIPFQHTSGQLLLTSTLPVGDTAVFTVYYHGQPAQDASGWGGFYFTNGIAFNLGVGFAADPHNYGRAWYPCLDYFTAKSPVAFHIRTRAGEYAVANGRLTGKQDLGDGTMLWHYTLSNPIPSYLVSLAVGPYASVTQRYDGSRTIPVRLIARASDTASVMASFAHLHDAIAAFEKRFGPEPFGRVGYVMVPFGGGAMEHPTNIAYPADAADGSLAFETLMAHELAHHWWGDYVTCTTAEDMWLNEGWASYAEHLFLEDVYGRAAYDKAVKENHNLVLHRSHISDNGFRAISGVPHAYTYGMHSYQKGADVLHTLRSYMGDGSFFSCIQDYLQQLAWGNGNSIDFMDHLTACSGVDMAPFFEGWVFQPGHPHFSIDSMLVHPEQGQYKVTIFVRQRLYGATDYLDKVPLTVTFRGANFEKATQAFTLSGRCIAYTTTIPFEPTIAALDVAARISDAISDHYAVYTGTQQNVKTGAYCTIQYLDVPKDSVLVYIAHNWVAPDRMLNPVDGLHLSDSRYWSVTGLWPSNTPFNIRLPYNGTTNQDGYLDHRWITNSEDSLVLLYRTGPGKEWVAWDDYKVQPLGSLQDKRGFIDVIGVKQGEYAMAIYDHSRQDTVVSDIPVACNNLTSIAPPTAPRLLQQLELHPNPASDTVTFTLPGGIQQASLQILNQKGQLQETRLLMPGKQQQINVSEWTSGMYILKVMDGDHLIAVGQLVVQ